MNKKVLFWIVAIVVFLLNIGLALADFPDQTDLIAYYTLDASSGTLVNDFNSGTDDLTNYGASYSADGILNSAMLFAGTDYLLNDVPSSGFLDGSSWTLSLWFNTSTISSGTPHIYTRTDSSNEYGVRIYASSSTITYWARSSGGHSLSYGTDSNYDDEQFHHLAVTWDGSAIKGYLDGSLDRNSPYYDASVTIDTTQDPKFGTDRTNTAGGSFNGQIDEIAIYDRILTSEEITNLSANPPPSAPFLIVSNFSITAKDIEENSINNFTAIVNGSTYSTTSGTITTNIEEDSGSVSVIIEDAYNNDGAYFNKSFGSIDTASNYEATGLYQAEISFIGREIITNNTIDGIIKYDNGSEVVSPILAGSYNFTFENSSYFDKTTEETIPALYNNTLNINEIYSGIINIKVQNAYSGENLSNFTGWIYSYDETYNQSFNSNDSNKALEVIDGDYLVYVENSDYAISEETNYKNITIADLEENETFSLYSNNSIFISVFDEDTTYLITGTNITITISGNATEEVYYTTTGYLFAEALLDGEYTVKLIGGNYSLKSYSITVADRSTQTLNAYLSAISEDVTFSFTDYDSPGLALDGVSMTMYRQINSTWTVIQTKTSDISGRALFQYVPGVQYKFFASYSGYDDKLFYLDPVLFTSYAIRMEKTTVISDAPGYNDISLIYYPKAYLTDEINNFTFNIASPSGSLTEYNLSLYYPGGSDSYSGSNALGEEFNFLFNISGASTLDYVNISYCYDTTIATQKCYNFRHLVYGSAGNNTFLANQNNTYGLDLFSRIIIATIIVLIVAGVLTMFAGSLVGLASGLLIFGFLVSTGFIPLWAILPGALVGFILILRRTE